MKRRRIVKVAPAINISESSIFKARCRYCGEPPKYWASPIFPGYVYIDLDEFKMFRLNGMSILYRVFDVPSNSNTRGLYQAHIRNLGIVPLNSKNRPKYIQNRVYLGYSDKLEWRNGGLICPCGMMYWSIKNVLVGLDERRASKTISINS